MKKNDSCEPLESRNYYLLNQLILKLEAEKRKADSRRFSVRNVGIFLRLVFLGAFKRIFIKIFNNNKKSACHYSLKNYQNFSNERIVVYTSIFGKYDSVLEPMFVSPNVDYFIFTDQEIPTDSSWKRIEIPDGCFENCFSPIDKNRYVKMLPHKFFHDYDISIYVDGNIQIVTDLRPLIQDFGNNTLGIHRYPVDCIYDMKNAIIAGKRAKRSNVVPQIKKYKKEGLPKHFGAFECNVIVRRHNNQNCIRLMEYWWDEFNSTSSKRDQLSFVYSLWKNNINPSSIYSLGNDVRLNPRFHIINHLKK